MAITSDRAPARSAPPSPDLDPSRRRLRRGAVTAYVVALLLFIALRGVPLDRVGLTVWIVAGLSAGAVGQGWRAWWRIMRDWLPFQGVLLAYDYSYGLAGRYDAGGHPREGDTNVVGAPLHAQLPIRVDEWTFGGTLPSQWVQQQVGTTPAWLAVLVTAVYCSHFVVTPLVAAGLWLRARERFVTWVRLVLALAVAGMTTYFLFPMSPPWLASQQGYIDGPLIERTSSDGWEVVGLRVAGQLLDDSQSRSNPVAAMPSLHMAFAVLAAAYFCCVTRRRWVRVLLVLHPAAMAFTLVYSGEHYVVDEVVGAAYALAVVGGWRWWTRRRERGVTARSARQVTDGEALLGPADRPDRVVEGGGGQADPLGAERH